MVAPKYQQVKVGMLYCMQPSVGIGELMGEPSIFHGASQDEILEMTKSHPLDCFSARFADREHLFLDNGTHRAYLIRFHSDNPSNETSLWARIFNETRYNLDILERIIREGRTVDKLKLRS